jgi:hypothetical protein
MSTGIKQMPNGELVIGIGSQGRYTYHHIPAPVTTIERPVTVDKSGRGYMGGLLSTTPPSQRTVFNTVWEPAIGAPV